ncbi:DUF3108 domain-containing protein [Marinomonas agarivorans]|nr:DUF3108 domain-containing protein [Marinomonas agarivorans]
MLLLVTWLVAFSLSVKATNSDTEAPLPFLAPYSATYSTVWKKGISLKVKGTQELIKQSDNQWLFLFKAKTFFASLKESSLFQLDENNQIQPLAYHYRSSAFGKERQAKLVFDWQKQQVVNDVKNTRWKMTIPESTLDKLSVQLQIRQDIKSKKTDLSYRIADGGLLKTWVFQNLGVEKINTKIGAIEAIKVTRIDNRKKDKYTTFWFSPKHDYLLVKLEHRKKKEFYQLNLESLL